MLRPLVALGALLLVVSTAATARAEGNFLAGNPVLGTEHSMVSLRLLGGYRANYDVLPANMPKTTTTPAEREQPGETLTNYVERVWSQARVYRRPGGAEVILRAKF